MVNVPSRLGNFQLVAWCLLLALCLTAQPLVEAGVDACLVAARVEANSSNASADLSAETQLTTGEDDNEGLTIFLTIATLSGLILAFTLPRLFHLSEHLPPPLHPPQVGFNN